MTFESVLFRQLPRDCNAAERAPEYFRDLNLEQIIAAVTAGKNAYNLRPFFHCRLIDPDDIAYRHEIMRDLEGPLFQSIVSFSHQMEEMRRYLRGAGDRHYRLNKQGWFLTTVAVYVGAVDTLAKNLRDTKPLSRGLRGFGDYLADYIRSTAYMELSADTERLQAELATVKYCLRIRDSTVTVTGYQNEADYSAEIEEVFRKFRQSDVRDYTIKHPEPTGANHIEAQIAELVAKLNPRIFRDLDAYCQKYISFSSPMIERFDREVQFYISYIQYIQSLKQSGLPFCYPQVSDQNQDLCGKEIFDLALAGKLLEEKTPVVVNDFFLSGEERVLVISGPNQGGKTTFARAFGQLHHLASLGLPVPGTGVRLFLCDNIFTHFEREERIEDMHGKLYDDLLRISRILAAATPQSLIVMNEIFSSTALEDAVFLAAETMRRILDLGCLCACVSFLDELSVLSPAVVSMVSTVVPEDPAQRTFKIVRRPADGRAYAMAIADKYGLRYSSIRERLRS